MTKRPERDFFPDWSPDGEWLVFMQSGARLWRVPAAGGNPEPLTEEGWYGTPRWSRDGKRVFFTGGSGARRNLWAVSPEDGKVRAVTELVGRQGGVGFHRLATDGEFLYFAWQEDLGDIWVMDVVTDEDS